jgi:hypothetical protein
MFQLTSAEKDEVVTICDHLQDLKFSPVCPNAFTKHDLSHARLPKSAIALATVDARSPEVGTLRRVRRVRSKALVFLFNPKAYGFKLGALRELRVRTDPGFHELWFSLPFRFRSSTLSPDSKPPRTLRS